MHAAESKRKSPGTVPKIKRLMLPLVLVLAAQATAALPPPGTPDTLAIAALHLGADGGKTDGAAVPGTLFAFLGSEIRAANATDGGARSYCWDCGSCKPGSLVKSNWCADPPSPAQQWSALPAASGTEAGAQQRGGPSGWVSLAPHATGTCLSANDDGRVELRVVACNSSDQHQHFSAPAANGSATGGTAVVSRRFPARAVNASHLDTTGVPGGYLLWPKPQLVEVHPESIQVTVDPATFRFTVAQSTRSKILSGALTRYRGWIFGPAAPNASVPRDGSTSGPRGPSGARSRGAMLEELVVTCTVPQQCGDETKLGEAADESYELRLFAAPAASQLSARSIWGLLRGLETFSQMVEHDAPVRGMQSNGTHRRVRAVPVLVRDQPRWAYRGLLVDTARHYLPLSVLRAHIDAMAWSKLNVLHWHHHDAAVWSLQSTSLPGLADAATAPGWQYSHEDIRGLVRFARERGVRVIPELETPGHANSIYKAVPAMGSVCYDDYLKTMPLRGEMNPCLNVTHDTLRTLLTEFAPLFEDEVVHLGGDEVAYNCWAQDESVKPGCRGGPANETSYSQLEQRFDEELHGMLTALGKRPMHWHDPLIERSVNLSTSTLIEVWDGDHHDALATTLSRGYSAVYAGSYYLDHLQLYWEDFYAADPAAFAEVEALPLAARQRLVGIEASMWSETVDHTNALTTVWPRAAAVAERAWSSANTTLPTDGRLNSGYVPGPRGSRPTPVSPSAGHQRPVGVLERMHAHRCRLVERGVAAAPAHFGQAAGSGWVLPRQGLCPQDTTPPP